MKKLLVAILMVTLASAVVWGASAPKKAPVMGGGSVVVPAAAEKSLIKLLNSRYSRAELTTGTFVGTEFCRACHGMNSFPGTKHYHALRQPMAMYTLQPGMGVMADYDGNGVDDFIQGLDFNTISSALDSTKPNAPILSYEPPRTAISSSSARRGLKVQVVATWAGKEVGNGQRFMVRVPVTDTAHRLQPRHLFRAPSPGAARLTASNSKYWYTGSTPKYAPGITAAALGNTSTGLQSQNYLQNCSGCHITGVRKAYVTPAGEYVVNPYPRLPRAREQPQLSRPGRRRPPGHGEHRLRRAATARAPPTSWAAATPSQDREPGRPRGEPRLRPGQPGPVGHLPAVPRPDRILSHQEVGLHLRRDHQPRLRRRQPDARPGRSTRCPRP